MHSRLIGARGKAIAKVMEKYKVDIRFPRDKSSDQVTITGLEENVEDCKEYLITLTEDYVSVPTLISFKLILCSSGVSLLWIPWDSYSQKYRISVVILQTAVLKFVVI